MRYVPCDMFHYKEVYVLLLLIQLRRVGCFIYIGTARGWDQDDALVRAELRRVQTGCQFDDIGIILLSETFI